MKSCHYSMFLWCCSRLHKYQGKMSLQCRFENVLKPRGFLDRLNALRVSVVDLLLEFGLQTVVKAEMDAIDRENNRTIVSKTIEKLNRDDDDVIRVSVMRFGMKAYTGVTC